MESRASTPGGCADALAQSPATPVLAVTATSAEPAPALPPAVAAILRRSADKGRPTCAMIVSAQRGETVDLTPRRANGQVENGPARDERVARNLETLAGQLASFPQTAPGLDPLAALDAAARRHPAAGTVYVISSGVSTVAPVDLRQLGWDLDAGRQATTLAGQDALPNLAGRRVVFVGLGDTAGRQPTPGIDLRNRLDAWWTALCAAARAAACAVDPTLIATRPPASHNVVPVVPLPAPAVTRNQIELPDALLFALNSAAISPDADPSLRAVVEQARTSGESIAVTGHTDALTGTSPGNLRLSLARAQAVAARLHDLGLPEGQIGPVRGVGSAGASVSREGTDPGQVARDRNVRIDFLTPTR